MVKDKEQQNRKHVQQNSIASIYSLNAILWREKIILNLLGLFFFLLATMACAYFGANCVF